jgi:hypothetical protein
MKSDGRTKESRWKQRFAADLIGHLGGSATIAQQILIRQAAQISFQISEMEEHDERYLQWVEALSKILGQLGLEAKVQERVDH